MVTYFDDSQTVRLPKKCGRKSVQLQFHFILLGGHRQSRFLCSLHANSMLGGVNPNQRIIVDWMSKIPGEA